MNPLDHIPEDIRQTAAQCRHYAMCKIDYLDTGLCPPAKNTPYVGYFPQGRMDLCDALANDPFPLADRQMPGYVVLPGSADASGHR